MSFHYTRAITAKSPTAYNTRKSAGTTVNSGLTSERNYNVTITAERRETPLAGALPS